MCYSQESEDWVVTIEAYGYNHWTKAGECFGQSPDSDSFLGCKIEFVGGLHIEEVVPVVGVHYSLKSFENTLHPYIFAITDWYIAVYAMYAAYISLHHPTQKHAIKPVSGRHWASNRLVPRLFHTCSDYGNNLFPLEKHFVSMAETSCFRRRE